MSGDWIQVSLQALFPSRLALQLVLTAGASRLKGFLIRLVAEELNLHLFKVALSCFSCVRNCSRNILLDLPIGERAIAPTDTAQCHLITLHYVTLVARLASCLPGLSRGVSVGEFFPLSLRVVMNRPNTFTWIDSTAAGGT